MSLKRVSSTKDHTILRHKDGHEFKVMHKSLPKEAMDEINSYPVEKDQHYQEGGEVLPTDDNIVAAGVNSGLGSYDMIKQNPDLFAKAQESYAKNQDVRQEWQKEDQMKQAQKQVMGAEDIQKRNEFRASHGLAQLPVPDVAQAQGMLQPPQQPQSIEAQGLAQPPQMPQQPQDPYGMNAFEQGTVKGINEQRAGIFGQANAEAQMGKQQAASLQQAQDKLQTLDQQYQETHKNLGFEREKVIRDLGDGHIDPKQYWHSMSTPGKISSIIGVILGGIGSGLTGQANVGLSMIEKQIQDNIQGQQKSIDNKFNLLSANREQFKNEADALNMTRAMYNDYTSNELKMAAAKASDPMAKARALQAAGQLDQQSAGIMSQIAMRKALMNGTQQGQINPAMAVRALVPEHQQASAYKELGEAQEAMSAKDNALSAFDKAAKLNTAGNRLAHPFQTPSQLKAIIGPVVASLSKATAGRFTEQDSQLLESLFKSISDNPGSVNVKRNQLLKLMQEKMHYPVLDSFGINPLQSSRFNSQGASRIAESKPVIK